MTGAAGNTTVAHGSSIPTAKPAGNNNPENIDGTDLQSHHP